MSGRLVMIVLGENCRRLQGPTGPPFVATLIADSQTAKGEATFFRVVLAGLAHLELVNPGIQLQVLPLSGKGTPMFDTVTKSIMAKPGEATCSDQARTTGPCLPRSCVVSAAPRAGAVQEGGAGLRWLPS